MPVIEKHSIDDVMSALDRKEIESLPYGAVELDRDGNILFYNSAEGDITGRDPKVVIGKNFFKEVAPCTNRPEFHGRFEEIVNEDKSLAAFEYTFDFQMQPTKVTVQMKRGTTGTFWIFVKRI